MAEPVALTQLVPLAIVTLLGQDLLVLFVQEIKHTVLEEPSTQALAHALVQWALDGLVLTATLAVMIQTIVAMDEELSTLIVTLALAILHGLEANAKLVDVHKTTAELTDLLSIANANVTLDGQAVNVRHVPELTATVEIPREESTMPLVDVTAIHHGLDLLAALVNVLLPIVKMEELSAAIV